jgi:hypothetical protein
VRRVQWHHTTLVPPQPQALWIKFGQKVQPVVKCLPDLKHQPVTAPRPPWPRTGALDHHVPGSCASTASSLVGVPLHGCSRVDEALPGNVGGADAGKFHRWLSGIGVVATVGKYGSCGHHRGGLCCWYLIIGRSSARRLGRGEGGQALLG